MTARLARWMARHGSAGRSVPVRILALLFGGTMFLVVIPVLLGWLCRFATAWVPWQPLVPVRMAIGLLATAGGLGLLAWSVWTFWRIGRGTPVPVVAPQILVKEGPYRRIRNPIQAGATLYYLGIGTLADSTWTGLLMFAVAFAAGFAWHRGVEEKELRLRFGDAYEEYRRETPFVIPRLGRRRDG